MPNPTSGHPDALGPVTAGVPKKLRMPRPSKHDAPTKPGVAETASAPEPEFSFNLKPADIARYLNRFVIGQTEAKKVLSVALCDHFQHVRLTLEGNTAPYYQKQNVLVLGPTGVGKTHLIRSAAELIGVPFVKGDATKFSETGYVGGDVDDLVRDLLRRAGGDAKKAQHGIIYLDEIDKLATREPGAGRDVSGRGVQTNLLKLMEDGDVQLVSPNDMTGQLQAAMSAVRGGGGPPSDTINTRHILFIVSGAFSGIDQIIRRRLLAKEAASKVEKLSLDQVLAQTNTTDLIAYGLEPEFIGRLPVRVACHGLSTDDLFDVLRKSESSLIHQYERAFAAYGIRCEFKDDGLRRLAELAVDERTGARGLMTVCERIFRELKFKLPSSRVKKFSVTARLVDEPVLEAKRILSGRG
jgi:endopeptidase Clp ATP-binding regulatory subunit ClpX